MADVRKSKKRPYMETISIEHSDDGGGGVKNSRNRQIWTLLEHVLDPFRDHIPDTEGTDNERSYAV
jgi:hypothetical protein